jgi:hypothetical protein
LPDRDRLGCRRCDALQLLHHTSPLITVGMVMLMPVFDNLTRLRAYEMAAPVALRIAISCVLALAVNITNYLVLGKTDPLTYQVRAPLAGAALCGDWCCLMSPLQPV